jgi:ribosomal protein L17
LTIGDGGLGRERRRLVEQLLQLGLEALLVAGGREAVDVAGHLAELERQALHLAERLEQRLGGLLRVLRALLLLVRGERLVGAS